MGAPRLVDGRKSVAKTMETLTIRLSSRLREELREACEDAGVPVNAAVVASVLFVLRNTAVQLVRREGHGAGDAVMVEFVPRQMELFSVDAEADAVAV